MSDMHILLSMGKQDPIVPVEQSEKVIELFKLRHANVTEVWVNSHEITQEGILKAQSFLS